MGDDAVCRVEHNVAVVAGALDVAYLTGTEHGHGVGLREGQGALFVPQEDDALLGHFAGDDVVADGITLRYNCNIRPEREVLI